VKGVAGCSDSKYLKAAETDASMGIGFCFHSLRTGQRVELKLVRYQLIKHCNDLVEISVISWYNSLVPNDHQNVRQSGERTPIWRTYEPGLVTFFRPQSQALTDSLLSCEAVLSPDARSELKAAQATTSHQTQQSKYVLTYNVIPEKGTSGLQHW